MKGHRRAWASATILATVSLAVGCGHPNAASVSSTISASPDQAQQIESWRHDHRSAFTALGTAMSDLGGALTASDWNAIHTDCPKLSAAGQTMRSALPTPDEKLTAALKLIVDNVDAAMVECPKLNASSDAIDANVFVKDLTVVEDQMAVVKGILK